MDDQCGTRQLEIENCTEEELQQRMVIVRANYNEIPRDCYEIEKVLNPETNRTKKRYKCRVGAC